MTISLDGFFEGRDHDISWHNVDDEVRKFAIEQLRETDSILFGRRTYELFEGIKEKLNLSLLKTRTFKSGNVLLYYQPKYRK
jgi:dihydrofolate reductase